MRKKFIIGNWKMHTNAAEAGLLAKAVVDGAGDEDRVSVVLCPPFPYLALVGEILKGSRIALGAQNLYPEKEGAFTGEVSPPMLLDLGCKYVILGLADLPSDTMGHVSIAYEPVWAIGSTGHHATPEQAQEAHTVIRHRFGLLFGQKSAQALDIHYGGSVKQENAAVLLLQDGVDGALIGGASLVADQFLAIIRAVTGKTQNERKAA